MSESARPSIDVPPLLQGDLSGGTVPQSNTAFTEQELIERKDLRRMRWTVFIALGLACLLFLCMLAAVLWQLFGIQSIAVISKANDWHALVLLSVGLLAAGSVALTLGLALVRMVDPQKKQDDESSALMGITTPQIEILRLIATLIKPGKD